MRVLNVGRKGLADAANELAQRARVIIARLAILMLSSSGVCSAASLTSASILATTRGDYYMHQRFALENFR